MQRSPQPRARRFIIADEAALAARDVHGQRDRRVVARHDQQAVQQRLEPHAPALRQQPDPRTPCSSSAALRDPHRLGRPRPLDHDQRGHDLRQARDRQHAQRIAAPEHLAGVDVEHEPGARRLAQLHVEGVHAGEVDAGRGLASSAARPRGESGAARGGVCTASGSRRGAVGPRRRRRSQVDRGRDGQRRQQQRHASRPPATRRPPAGRRPSGPRDRSAPAPTHRVGATTAPRARRSRAARAPSRDDHPQDVDAALDRARDREADQQAR